MSHLGLNLNILFARFFVCMFGFYFILFLFIYFYFYFFYFWRVVVVWGSVCVSECIHVIHYM